MQLKAELEARWFLNQYTHETLFDLYDQGNKTFYLGVDPTADSLHLGNFVGFMHAVQYMKRGNKLILIVGGATGMIGDPGGKDSERNFLDEATLANNVAAITKQVKTILDHLTELTGHTFDFEVKNNADFYVDMWFLQFLREIGKYITINQMMNKETVKKRIEDPEKSISYTEFSYMLLQGYDYLRLYQDYGCMLQIAGSDQRGNIVTGTELIKKKMDVEVYGATCPLIVDSTGKKFGKSEGNALRLDPTKNSPYVIYQYFMNTADADIERYFKLLTLVDFEEIKKILEEHANKPEDRIGQQALARSVVKTVFGNVTETELIVRILFDKWSPVERIQNLAPQDVDSTLHALHQAIGGKNPVAVGTRIIETIVEAGLAPSNAEAKTLIKNNGVVLNEISVHDMSYELQEKDFLQGKIVLLRKGKKQFATLMNA
jgi:tyrosyl-tRNA synthetase